VNLDPESLRKEIDEVLEELDRVEAEVLELFADVGGAEALQKVVAYKRQQERLSPLARSGESQDTKSVPAIPQKRENAKPPAAPPGPGTSPPGTP